MEKHVWFWLFAALVLGYLVKTYYPIGFVDKYLK